MALQTAVKVKYQPGEHDKTAYLLNAIHVQEGEYFSRRVHDDIDGIMEDIKEAHKGRAESAPEKSVAAELKKDLDEVANFKGSRLEQWLLIYCKQNRIPYNRLTEEEKQSLIRIGSKSDFMKSHIPQRGKNENEKLNTYSQFWRQKFICRYFWTPT